MNETLQQTKPSSYRWVIAISTLLPNVVCGYNQFELSVFSAELMERLSLTATQFSAIITSPFLMGVILAILAGVLSDRIGTRMVVGIGCILALIGTFGRLVADSYGTMFVCMLLTGSSMVMISATAAKLFKAWFPPRQINVAMGIMFAGGGIGASLGQATAALFPSMDAAFSFGCIICVISSALWFILVRNKPAGAPDIPPLPVVQNLGKVIRLKNVWLVGISVLMFMGCNMTCNSFLPGALSSKGITLEVAGVLAACFAAGILVGNIMGPTIIPRFPKFKMGLLLFSVLGMVLTYGGWLTSVPAPALSGILFFLGGFSAGAVVPNLLTITPLLDEVTASYVGAAGGFVCTIQMLGGFVLPSYVITPISGGNFGAIILMASLCSLIMGIVAMILPDIGPKLKNQQKQ